MFRRAAKKQHMRDEKLLNMLKNGLFLPIYVSTILWGFIWMLCKTKMATALDRNEKHQSLRLINKMMFFIQEA